MKYADAAHFVWSSKVVSDMINVNVSYATVAEREDGLGQTSDIYDDVNTRQ